MGNKSKSRSEIADILQFSEDVLRSPRGQTLGLILDAVYRSQFGAVAIVSTNPGRRSQIVTEARIGCSKIGSNPNNIISPGEDVSNLKGKHAMLFDNYHGSASAFKALSKSSGDRQHLMTND